MGPQDILDLWFPETGFWDSPESFQAWIEERMYGGMDEVICARYAGVTTAAARGELDHWAETARGRLALLILLDQFPRSLWRDTPAAFAQDIKANLLVMEALANGHFEALRPWEQVFFTVALGHCEGPDHLARIDLIDRLTEAHIIPGMPPALAHLGDLLRAQNARTRSVIERFGRHPHRNPIYGRVSTPSEEAYIATGDFPHVQGGDGGGA
ncbi:MAG: DUF924 family protein [Pseudomonadota bacterium]